MKNSDRFQISLTAVFTALLLVGGCGGGEEDDEPECGNGIVEGRELCDRDESIDFTCNDLQLGEGIITCTADCMLDLSVCSTAPVCGNGVREGTEECDASALGDYACDDLGHGGGELRCDATCAFDVGLCCDHRCPTEGETQCFGDVVQSCSTQPGGCLDWEDTLDCAANLPPQVCDNTGAEARCVLPCADQCTNAGDERCQWDAVVQTCAVQPDGCLDWSLTDDCSIHDPVEVCDASGTSAGCVPACTDNCTILNEFRCTGNTLEKCDLVFGGCLEWIYIHDCTLNPCGTCSEWGGTAECSWGC